MSTKRQTILARIDTDITAITSGGSTVFKTVDVKRPTIADLETASLPACYIYSDREARVPEGNDYVIGKETWEWFIVLEVWAMDSDMEDLLNKIHTAMYADYKLNDNVSWSEREGVDFFVIEPDQRLEGMVIPYRVVYRHSLGDMSTT